MADDTKPKRKTVPFASPKLQGGRFDQQSIPLEVLPVFDRFRDLVLELAKSLFRSNRERKNVPAGFEEDFRLRLVGIDKGSAIPQIMRELPTALVEAALAAQAHLGVPPNDGHHDQEKDYEEYDEALGLLQNTLRALVDGKDLPSQFPLDLLPMLEDLGAAFEDDEVFELRLPNEEHGPRFDGATRLRLRTEDESRSVQRFEGTITGFDWDGTFKLRPVGSGRAITGKHSPLIQKDLLEALRQRQFIRVRMAADTRFAAPGVPKQIVEVLSLTLWSGSDEATVRQVEKRFADLGGIQQGWLDGDGQAINPELVVWLKEWLVRMMVERYLPKPRLYPTPDGNIEAEWTMGRWELTATFDLLKRTAFVHATDLDSDEEAEATFEIMKLKGEESFLEFLKRFRAFGPEVTHG